jgi:multiple sugar transport system permease protein
MASSNALGQRRRRGLSRGLREALSGYAFISPWLVGVILFVAGPMLFSLFVSFFKWDMFKGMTFIALGNYIKAFTDDQYAMSSLLKTLLFVAVETPYQLVIALLLALLLNSKLKLTGVARALVYLPAVLSGAISGSMWKFMMDKDLGVLNYFTLTLFNVKIPWLIKPDLAMYSIALTGALAAGTSMILFLAALQSIPAQYYEAADMDGASPRLKFFRITMPFIGPTTLYNLIIIMIAQFQCVVPFMVITGGGPAKSTYVYAYYEYETAFRYLRFGQAASLSWIILVVVLIATMAVLASSRLWVYYESERSRS